jgi:hypothetical protein
MSYIGMHTPNGMILDLKRPTSQASGLNSAIT